MTDDLRKSLSYAKKKKKYFVFYADGMESKLQVARGGSYRVERKVNQKMPQNQNLLGNKPGFFFF